MPMSHAMRQHDGERCVRGAVSGLGFAWLANIKIMLNKSQSLAWQMRHECGIARTVGRTSTVVRGVLALGG